MKLTALLFTLTVFASTSVYGQSTQNREVYPDQAEHVEHNQAVISFSGDFVTAFRSSLFLAPTGHNLLLSNNFAQIGIVGAGNSANLYQFGVANLAIIEISGNNNLAALTQNGNENLSSIEIDGNNNFIDYTQLGNNNYLGLSLFGDNFDQIYVQEGNNHSVQMFGVGQPISVEQTGGAGMSVVITNE